MGSDGTQQTITWNQNWLMQNEALHQTIAPAWYEYQAPDGVQPEYNLTPQGRWHAKARTTAQKTPGGGDTVSASRPVNRYV